MDVGLCSADMFEAWKQFMDDRNAQHNTLLQLKADASRRGDAEGVKRYETEIKKFWFGEKGVEKLAAIDRLNRGEK